MFLPPAAPPGAGWLAAPLRATALPRAPAGRLPSLQLRVGRRHLENNPGSRVERRAFGALVTGSICSANWCAQKFWAIVKWSVAVLVLAGWPLMEIINVQVRRRRRSNRPKRIILVRHGESEGNVDARVYTRKPDSQIQLTDRGYEQGVLAGKRIRELIGDESARFFFSPYMRTRQTLLAILEAFQHRRVQLTSEPRLREQDFGNFQDPEVMEKVYKERQKFGRFYYRFPSGEAGTDVYDRVCDFWSTLYRFMDTPPHDENHVQNFVIVTHGLLSRIFCMCYFRWTVLEFDQVWNPSNCEIWVLEKTRAGRYRLNGRWEGSSKSFGPIKFGADKDTPLYPHMLECRAARDMVPGTPGVLDDPALAHLKIAAEYRDRGERVGQGGSLG